MRRPGAAAGAIAFRPPRPTASGMTSSDQGPPDRPRSEPEIIPPERGDRRQGGRSHVWVWVADREGMRQANVALPGPFTIFLALLGAVLIWIPIFVLAVGALLIAAAARQYWWRFRRWLSQH